MTFPITPDETIHTDPTAEDTAELALQTAYETLQLIFAGVPQQILQGVINAILGAFGLGAFEGPLDAQLAAVEQDLGNVGVQLQQAIGGIANVQSIISMIQTVLSTIATAVNNFIDTLVNIFGGGTALVNTTIADLQTATQTFFSGAAGAATEIQDLLEAVGQTTVAGLADLINLIQQIIDGIANALGLTGTGHSVADIQSALASIPQANIVGLPAIVADVDSLVSDIQSLISSVGGSAIGDVGTAISDVQSDLGDIISGAGVSTATEVGSAISGAATDVGDIIAGAGATTASEAGTLISDASGAISDATGVISGTVATAATDFGAVVGGLLGDIVGGLTGAAPAQASSPQVQSAAQAIAAAQATQAMQLAAVNSQLPTFYGGNGTSGLNTQVSLSGSLPSSFTSFTTSSSATPVKLDAVGSGGTADSASSASGTHTVAEGATVLAYVQSSGSVSSLTIGGVAMTPVSDGNESSPLSLFELADAPGGTDQAVETTFSATAIATFGTVSYTGASVIGLPSTTTGGGAPVSQSLTCPTGGLISQAFGSPSSFTSDSGGTQRFSDSVVVLGSGLEGLVIQDSTSSATFAADLSSSTAWAGIGVVLSPAAATIAQFAALLDQTADTDQETTSGIWSTPIVVNGGARYLFLRVNSGFTSYLFVKWFATGTTSSPVFNVALGCVVAGVETVFDTFTSESTAEANAQITGSSNSVISLEATADTITFSYAGGGAADISFIDKSGVSQIGADFRNAGFGTDESPVTFPISFAFFDSGPTTGPQAAFVATVQGSQGGETFAKLATTTDQVTVNIGPKGTVLVGFSADITIPSGSEGVTEITYSLAGSNTRAAGATGSPIISYKPASETTVVEGPVTVHLDWLETELTPGATTFSLEYMNTTGVSIDFANRRIFAIPL